MSPTATGQSSRMRMIRIECVRGWRFIQGEFVIAPAAVSLTQRTRLSACPFFVPGYEYPPLLQTLEGGTQATLSRTTCPAPSRPSRPYKSSLQICVVNSFPSHILPPLISLFGERDLVAYPRSQFHFPLPLPPQRVRFYLIP